MLLRRLCVVVWLAGWLTDRPIRKNNTGCLTEDDDQNEQQVVAHRNNMGARLAPRTATSSGNDTILRRGSVFSSAARHDCRMTGGGLQFTLLFIFVVVYIGPFEKSRWGSGCLYSFCEIFWLSASLQKIAQTGTSSSITFFTIISSV